jgi:tetratricopeptide (TPR) repeat protein
MNKGRLMSFFIRHQFTLKGIVAGIFLLITVASATARDQNEGVTQADSIYQGFRKLHAAERVTACLKELTNMDIRIAARLVLADSALQLAKHLNNGSQAFEACYQKVLLLNELQKCGEAEQTLNEAKTYLKRSDLRNFAKADILMGKIFTCRNSYDSAEMFLNKGLEALLLVNDSLCLAGAYISLGNMYLKKNEYSTAILNYKSALEFSSTSHEDGIYYTCYSNLGIAYRNIYNYELSLKSLLLALNFAGNDSPKAGSLYNSIGILYGTIKEYDKALDYLNKSAVYFEKKGNATKIAAIYQNIGNIMKIRNDFPGALYYFRLALKALEMTATSDAIIPVWLNLASLYNLNGNPDSALLSLNRVDSLIDPGSSSKNLAYSVFMKALAYKLKGDRSKSLSLLHKAAKISEEINFTEQLKEIENELFEFYKSAGDYKTALTHYINYISYKDSMAVDEFKQKAEEMVTKYEVEAKENENKILLHNQVINQQKISRQRSYNTIISLISGLLLMTVVFAFYLVSLRNHALKRSNDFNMAHVYIAEQEGKIKDQEKAIAEEKARLLHTELELQRTKSEKSVSVILKSSEISSRLLAEFTNLKKYCNQQGREMINNILAEFSGFPADKNWNLFYNEFNELHPDFFRKLDQLNKGLTESEIKLAAFFKMGMRTREIADITFQSQNNINVTKNRISKKLGLANSAELYEYIRNI